MAFTYYKTCRVSSPSVSKPKFPYPLHWRPKHRGTYLVIAGLGDAQ